MAMIIAAAALIFALANLALGVTLWLRVRKLYSYPGLLGSPVIGNLYYFYRTLLLFSMDSLVNHSISVAEKYGENGLCFHWVNGLRKALIVSSPHFVKETAFHPNLSDKPHSMYAGFTTYFGGPFAKFRSDEVWKQDRKEYNNFLKKNRIESDYLNTFIKCGDKLVEMMLSSPSAVDAHHGAITVTQLATLKTLFHVDTRMVYHPSIIKLMTMLKDMGSYVFANSTLTLISLTILRPLDFLLLGEVTKLRKLGLEVIDKKLNSNQPPLTDKEQFLSLQFGIRSRKYNTSTKTLINQMQELLVTATHTVTAALSSPLVFLAVLPDLQERAFKEQEEIFGGDNRDPTLEDLRQMHFLERFIKETLRFVAPPAISKVSTREININGITIPPGTTVLYLMRYMRMDPKYWKDPEIFDPDRFLEENDTLKYFYTPFGIGVRNCPGMYFATIFMKITLSKVLRRLRLRTVEKDFRFEDIKYKYYLMTEMTNPPLLQVEERI